MLPGSADCWSHFATSLLTHGPTAHEAPPLWSTIIFCVTEEMLVPPGGSALRAANPIVPRYTSFSDATILNASPIVGAYSLATQQEPFCAACAFMRPNSS